MIQRKPRVSRLLLSGILPAQKQQELTEVAQALDPIGLFQQLEQLQQAVFRCAVGCSPFVSSPLSVPLHVFSVEQCIVGKLPEERKASDPPAGLETLCREQERRKRVHCFRRTHKDPFEGEWEQIFCWLQANPEPEPRRHFPPSYSASPLDAINHCKSARESRGMRKIRAYPLETVKNGWQEEVIRGPLSSPVSARCSASISWPLSNEQPPG